MLEQFRLAARRRRRCALPAPVQMHRRGVAHIHVAVARQFLGHTSEWLVEMAGDVRLRLWAEPGTEPPERLAVRAARSRWVPDDEGGAGA